MAAAASSVLGSWKRIPPFLRRGIVLYGVYRGYEFIQCSDVLYKLFNPGRHALGATILDLDLTSLELVSHEGLRSNSPFAQAEQLAIPRVIATLRIARDDPRVAGLVCRGVSGLRGAGIAEISELRRAVQDFSAGKGGKPTVLHLPEGLGGSGNGTIPLYFASAFDSAHIQPTSPVIIPGLSFGSLFFKGALDKLGVTPVKVARKEYKTAADSFTETSFTDANRESTEALLDSIMSIVTDGVSEGRGIAKEKVIAAFDEGIMSASDAVSRGLLDACAYRDELPGIMRASLADGEASRSTSRIAADMEWREAMAALVAAWSKNDGAEIARWAGGSRLASVDSYAGALQFAVEFCDPTRDAGAGRDVIDAELRALRAHLNWIDTRPWEALPKSGAQRQEHTLTSLGNAANIVELERRMCVEAIAALEKMPKEKEEVIAKAKTGEKGAIGLADVKLLSRWTRAMWRSKTLTARMVGSVQNLSDPVQADVPGVAGSTPRGDSASKDAAVGPCAPRLFLAHEEGEPVIPLAPSPDVVPKKARLRYTRLTDYVETVLQENRAASKRESSWTRGRTSLEDTSLKGVPTTEYFGGTVDQKERLALTHLCDFKTPYIQPWRLSSGRTSPTVAVINIDGAIADDGAEDVRGAIRRANKDVRVHAIVLRVDSPGGSATASDLIARSVDICTKPVVASMSNVCASGGVFLTAPCEKIYAEQGTITGSIGVIFSTFLPIALFEKLGITVDSVERGRFAKFFGASASVTEWDEAFRKRIDAMIDDMYNSFVKIASRGRGKSFEEMEPIARGRVWSGTDAKRLGLIDEFGGLEDAAGCAAELAGGEPGVSPNIVSYPTTADRLEGRLRKMGLLRSRIDEEGDETVPEKKESRRRRRRLVTLFGDGEDDEDGDDSGTDSDAEDDGAPDGGDGDVDTGEDRGTPADGLNLGWVSKLGLVPIPSQASNRQWASADRPESLGLDGPGSFPSAVALWLLRRCDDLIMGSDSSSMTALAVEYILGTMLRAVSPLDAHQHAHLAGVSAAAQSEICAVAATTGRPSMIMSPQVHTNLEVGKR